MRIPKIHNMEPEAKSRSMRNKDLFVELNYQIHYYSELTSIRSLNRFTQKQIVD